MRRLLLRFYDRIFHRFPLYWNKPSIDFYRSLGAVPMEEWTVYRVTGETLKKLAE